MHSCTGSDPRGAGCDELGGSFGVADASCRFYAYFLAHDLAHEGHVFDGGSSGAETGGGFDESRARRGGECTGFDLFLPIQQGGLDDDLGLGAHLLAAANNTSDVLFHATVVLGLQGADIDNHVDFRGAVCERTARLVGLDVRCVGA